jgi:nitroreductase
MTPTGKTARTAAPLHPLLASRWSPRALDPRHELDETALTALLEAARWAPSASNTQPWRFAVTLRGTAGHAAVLDALAAGNRDRLPLAALQLPVDPRPAVPAAA